MEFFHSVTAARVLVILGMMNFAAICFLFLTCRCLPLSRLGKKLMTGKFYQSIYKLHCYTWLVLLPSVLVHAFLGYMFLGWPA